MNNLTKQNNKLPAVSDIQMPTAFAAFRVLDKFAEVVDRQLERKAYIDVCQFAADIKKEEIYNARKAIENDFNEKMRIQELKDKAIESISKSMNEEDNLREEKSEKTNQQVDDILEALLNTKDSDERKHLMYLLEKLFLREEREDANYRCMQIERLNHIESIVSKVSD